MRYPRLFASLVRLEHTIFALPFAYVGAFLAGDDLPAGSAVAWITVAMIGARSLAMALNRLIDAGIDARNPRTATRELPRGALRPLQVVVFAILALVVFVVAVYRLDPAVHWLWPVPVAGFVLYPYLKRFTWLCHAWLGVLLGVAPIAAWLAVEGEIAWPGLLLGAAVATWVSGFDVLYGLFDLAVDREQGLHSVPARFGLVVAFRVSRASHLAAAALLVVAGLGIGVGPLYWVGTAAAVGLLAYEHAIVSPRDLRRLDTAFFTLNGVIAIVFFGFVVADVVAR